MAVQADALEVILRVIGARTFQAQMGAARGSVAGLSKEVKGSDAAMAGMSRRSGAFAAVAKTTAKIGIGALVLATAEGVSHAVKFQKEMTLVGTQAGATTGQVRMLSRQVLGLARIRPQGPEELARGLYHFQSVFQNAHASFQALQVASEGAAVGNAHLEDTSNALGAALRAIFRDSTPTLNQMKSTMGTLNAIIGAGNMRMDDLALALGTAVVPAGITAGLTLTDIGGALAVLTDEGQRADNAATHLRMAFTLLSANSKKSQDELERIGIRANELGTIMHGPGGLVSALEYVRQQLQRKFPTFGPQLSGVTNYQQALTLAKRFDVISKAFGGARSSATIMLLLNNLELLRQKTEHVRTHTDDLDAAYKRWKNTSDAILHTSLSALMSDLITFGDKIRDPVISGIKVLIDTGDFLVRKIHIWGPVVLGFAGAWLAVRGAILLVNGGMIAFEGIQIIGTILTLIPAVTSLGDAFALASLAIEATPVGWIITGLALLAIAIALIILHWNEFKRVVRDVLDFVATHPYIVLPALGLLGMAAVILVSHWKSAKHWFIGFWHWMKQAAVDAVNFIIGVLNHFNVHIPSWIPGIGGHHLGFHINPLDDITPVTPPSDYSRGVRPPLGPVGTLGALPGGNREVHSLRRPRAHTPRPEAIPENQVFEVHSNVFLDGNQIFKSVSKHAANKKARK